MKENFMELNELIHFLKEINQLDALQKLQAFICEIKKQGFDPIDFECQIDEEGVNFVAKHKLLPSYKDNIFKEEDCKKIKSYQTKISSYLEIKTQLIQITDGLLSIRKNNLSDDAKEMILAGCLNIYCSFFQDGKNFSRLNIKLLKNTEIENQNFILEIFNCVKLVRDKHFSHKDLSHGSHILSIYNNSNTGKIVIEDKENIKIYFYQNEIFIQCFAELVSVTSLGIENLLKEAQEEFEEILNSPHYFNKMKQIPSVTLPEYQKQVREIQLAKGNFNRDEWQEKLAKIIESKRRSGQDPTIP